MTRILKWLIHNMPIRFVRHRSTTIRPYGGVTLNVYPDAVELTAKLAAAQARLRER